MFSELPGRVKRLSVYIPADKLLVISNRIVKFVPNSVISVDYFAVHWTFGDVPTFIDRPHFCQQRHTRDSPPGWSITRMSLTCTNAGWLPTLSSCLLFVASSQPWAKRFSVPPRPVHMPAWVAEDATSLLAALLLGLFRK